MKTFAVFRGTPMVAVSSTLCSNITEHTRSLVNYPLTYTTKRISARNSSTSHTTRRATTHPQLRLYNIISQAESRPAPPLSTLTRAVTIFANVIDAYYCVSKPFNFHAFSFAYFNVPVFTQHYYYTHIILNYYNAPGSSN